MLFSVKKNVKAPIFGKEGHLGLFKSINAFVAELLLF